MVDCYNLEISQAEEIESKTSGRDFAYLGHRRKGLIDNYTMHPYCIFVF